MKAKQQDELGKKWVEQDVEPEIPEFTGNPGIKMQIPEDANNLDIFRLFVTDEFYDLLVEQINLYATQYVGAHPNIG